MCLSEAFIENTAVGTRNVRSGVLLALLALTLADVLCFVWLHYELPDECLGDESGYWLCY
jgi:hypothetical protein